MSKKHAKIVGVGRYLPEKILDNAYFEGIVETSDEWILQRVGIKAVSYTHLDVYNRQHLYMLSV